MPKVSTWLLATHLNQLGPTEHLYKAYRLTRFRRAPLRGELANQALSSNFARWRSTRPASEASTLVGPRNDALLTCTRQDTHVPRLTGRQGIHCCPTPATIEHVATHISSWMMPQHAGEMRHHRVQPRHRPTLTHGSHRAPLKENSVPKPLQ